MKFSVSKISSLLRPTRGSPNPETMPSSSLLTLLDMPIVGQNPFDVGVISDKYDNQTQPNLDTHGVNQLRVVANDRDPWAAVIVTNPKLLKTCDRRISLWLQCR